MKLLPATKTYLSSLSITSWIVIAAVVLALGVAIWSFGGAIGVKWQKSRAQAKDAKTDKILAEERLKNEKLQKQNESLRLEIEKTQATLDSKAKNLDAKTEAIEREGLEVRRKIEQEATEEAKRTAEIMASEDECLRCRHLRFLYEKNGLVSPVSCEECN